MALKLTSCIAQPSLDLEGIGLEEARRRARISESSSVRTKMTNLVDRAHDIAASQPKDDELAFSHAGLCQTFLPHRELETKHSVWRRQNGRFTLYVKPGVMHDQSNPNIEKNADRDYVGVPFGPKARLIMIYLQTEGLKSRDVYLGKSLAAFLRSIGVPTSGGVRGAAPQVKEQFKRIARSTFTMQFTGDDSIAISDTSIVDGLQLWSLSSDEWEGTLQLSEKFRRHLLEHSVPLDRRAIQQLSGSSLGLDLYTFMAYRLPQLKKDLMLSWGSLQAQIGSEYDRSRDLAKAVRAVLPTLMTAYPHANVEQVRGGLLFKPSPPSVPTKTLVNGFRLISSKGG